MRVSSKPPRIHAALQGLKKYIAFVCAGPREPAVDLKFLYYTVFFVVRAGPFN